MGKYALSLFLTSSGKRRAFGELYPFKKTPRPQKSAFPAPPFPSLAESEQEDWTDNTIAGFFLHYGESLFPSLTELSNLHIPPTTPPQRLSNK